MHTVEVDLDDRGGELMTLRESRITRCRVRLTRSLPGSRVPASRSDGRVTFFPLGCPRFTGGERSSSRAWTCSMTTTRAAARNSLARACVS